MPPLQTQEQTQEHARRPAWLLYAAALVLAGLVVAFVLHARDAGNGILQAPVQQPAYWESVPPPSPEILAQLDNSRGFDAVVSFTARGFEPAELSLKKGMTARFVNNAGIPIRVLAADGDANAVCAAKALDSCVLQPGAFWEHTFDAGGTFDYRDGLGVATGTVVVR